MVKFCENLVFANRRLSLVFFALVTVVLGFYAAKTRIDASFYKQLPSDHEYIRNFKKYADQFGGANRVVIALMVDKGDIFTPEFLKTLKNVTDDVFYIPGVDRSQVTSLWTPNVRYIEVVEDGLQGGNVIPPDFVPNPAGLERVRQNVIKSGRVGMLVANDFTGAIVLAQLHEFDPQTGRKLDYTAVADALEKSIRAKYESSTIHLDIHIIGFAKVVGDITDGARGVMLFFLVSVIITAALLYWFSQSWILTVLPLITSTCAVVWQMGLLNVLGFGIDPLSILVPFLVFAIAMSHATQMLRAFRFEYNIGGDEMAAARSSFTNLFVPGCVAIITDTIGFLTIWLVKVPIIQELAITASLGVVLIIFTDRFLLPVLLSYTKMAPEFRRRVNFRRFALQPTWRKLVGITGLRASLVTIAISAVALVVGIYQSNHVRIGDAQAGVPELRPNSRYNLDTTAITSRFSIGVDIITVLVETVPNGVIDHEVMSLVDRFAWRMRNIEGVQSTLALPDYARTINAGWNEGSLKMRVIARNKDQLAQSVAPVETATGLLNNDGSVIPVMIYLKDHKAETIKRVVAAVKEFRAANSGPKAQFQLATGNVGVMAATNEVVEAAQFPIVAWVYASTIVLCLLSFRSWRATVCVIVPLVVVSYFGYALKVWLGIGLKTSTLPVIALGVGIGIDYGIYLFSAVMDRLREGDNLEDALCFAFGTMGTSVIFTGFTLAVGVGTWAFSDLKFQADMGLLLAALFFFNMLGAILLMPALARWFFPGQLAARVGASRAPMSTLKD
jgi:hypothetical protein